MTAATSTPSNAVRAQPSCCVHGVTLGVGTWVHQLKQLAGNHRVIAISQRGHGESTAGEDGYSFDRMALDIIEVLHALDVHNAVYVGHSMGGMVGQTAAVNAPKQFNAHISGLVLVATAAGPLVPSPRGVPIALLLAGGAGRGMKYPTQRGTLLPHEDLGSWIVRSTFGLHPRSTDLALARSLTAAMSPEAMTQLIPSLLTFDVHAEISAIDLPTRVVVGITRPVDAAPYGAGHEVGHPGGRTHALARIGPHGHAGAAR